MYTQCPECDVAFRITAKVLKQAAGKVRCGGCGVAFNALAYLSEENPSVAKPPVSAPDKSELEAGTPPKSISAAQSAALLKTLEQLAGEDIRIEDTGVEWRVHDPKEDPYDDIEADPTPTIAHEPMRFDDNTPLPDDFETYALSVAAPEPAIPVETERSPDESQIDLVFGDPDEWEDLLGAVEEAPDLSGIEVLEEIIDDPDEEEIELGAEVQPLDMDTQFSIQAEAMGIDLSGMHQRIDGPQELEVPDELEEPEEPETSIDDDLIAAAFEAEAATRVAGIEEPEEDLAAALDFALEDMLEDEIEFESELTDFDDPDVIEVPEMTEEEMTINRMIDQDLLAIAVEDEDGFTSTIAQKQFSSAAEVPRKRSTKQPARDDTADKPLGFEDALSLTGRDEEDAEDSAPLFETIIMEGDFLHHDLDKARLAAERRAASASEFKSRHGNDRNRNRDGKQSRVGMIGAAALLLVVLISQVIHHSRAAFATSATFQKTVGPIYRMVGSPVTPT
ncbi:MAG: zinc-ribbon domain-containing protein [Proteobacteria bacterium]|nr:zinc-ribbon domain-containing protein [Pseudomonadota bacterium]